MTDHGEAIEYELLTIGKHISDLGTRRLTWRDLKVVAVWRTPGGALDRSVDPERAGWSADTYLQAAAVDYLALAVWQRGNGKGPKPTPVWRPGTKPKAKKKSLAEQALARQAAEA